MTIVINTTKHGIFIDGNMLIPGTNCIDGFNACSDAAKFYIEEGEIKVSEPSKMNDKEQKEAVDNANTHATLETLKKTFKKADVSKQKKKLDDFDKSIKESSEVVEEGED